MSIDHSDQLHLPDAPDLDPSLEATVTPKFDMCLFRSTLTEKHVEKFSQIYAIPLDLHPRAPPAGFTMDQLSNDHIAPIAMSWRHHDSSVADVLPSPSEYNAADVATLLEVPILLHKPYNSLLYVVGLSPTWKGLGHVPKIKGPRREVLTMAEFLRLPNLGACKIVAGALLPSNFPVDNYLTNPAVAISKCQTPYWKLLGCLLQESRQSQTHL
ncbi:hypothetical protein Tco_0891836 [Tanacetum coccineum]|uniref:Uncharacterized protein n=1 Tax=Tanacetum coccineum TaxID=301880 RepID=A0ABQ5C9H7_9ASTR